MKPLQSCGACKHADFSMTEHERPRFKPDAFTNCNAPIDISGVRLPECVQVTPSLASYLQRSKHGVRPNSGAACVLFEAADPLPTRTEMFVALKDAGWQWLSGGKFWEDPNAPRYSGGYGTVTAWRRMQKAKVSE